MEFSIKTILRILFVLSCAQLQACHPIPAAERRRDAAAVALCLYITTFGYFQANNSTNMPRSTADPNTNPIPASKRRPDALAGQGE